MMCQMRRWALSPFEAFLKLIFQFGRLSFLRCHNNHQFPVMSWALSGPQLSNNSNQVQTLKNVDTQTLGMRFLNLEQHYNIFLPVPFYRCLFSKFHLICNTLTDPKELYNYE